MRTALLMNNNPKSLIGKQSHPSFVGEGEWKVNVSGALSKVTVHVHSLDGEEQRSVGPDEVFKGPARIVLTIENHHLDDKRFAFYAERL